MNEKVCRFELSGDTITTLILLGSHQNEQRYLEVS